MTDDLKLGSTNTTDFEGMSGISDNGPTKKSGCGCITIGVFLLVLFIILPGVAGFIYINTISEDDLAKVFVDVVKHPSFGREFKKSINQNNKLTQNQKTAVLTMYDKFATGYDKLPYDKKKIVRSKFLYTGQVFITKQDPQRAVEGLKEVMDIFGVDTSFMGAIKTDPHQIDKIKDPVKTPAPDPDPYGFDLPSQNTKQPPPPPTTQPSPYSNPSQFDF